MHRFWLAGLLACLLPAVAPATTFPRLSTADLVRRAERVSCAACETCEERRDPRSGIVFTHVTLRLLEDIKGRSPSGTIRLRYPGGTDGGVRTVVAGMPRFTPGEESILMLGRTNAEGYPVLVQATHGVVPLKRDTRGRRFLGRRVTGLSIEGTGPVSLDAFRGAVRALPPEKKK